MRGLPGAGERRRREAPVLPAAVRLLRSAGRAGPGLSRATRGRGRPAGRRKRGHGGACGRTVCRQGRDGRCGSRAPPACPRAGPRPLALPRAFPARGARGRAGLGRCCEALLRNGPAGIPCGLRVGHRSRDGYEELKERRLPEEPVAEADAEEPRPSGGSAGPWSGEQGLRF